MVPKKYCEEHRTELETPAAAEVKEPNAHQTVQHLLQQQTVRAATPKQTTAVFYLKTGIFLKLNTFGNGKTCVAGD